MAELVPFDPRVEVSGLSILGKLQALQPQSLARGKELLAALELGEVEPEGWYPQGRYLTWLHRLEEVFGEGTLRRLGRAVPARSKFPPEIRTLERALLTLDIAYHLNHRGGEIGMYVYHATEPKRCEMHCETPYGCEFDQGILQGLADRFLPAEHPGMKLAHKPGTPCRRHGATACIYLLEW